MLPRTDCMTITDSNRLPCFNSTDTIRNDTILCPITSTYYITCAHRRDRFTMLGILSRIHKGSAPTADGDLTGTFAATIRIITSHRFILCISMVLFAVLIAFVGSDHHRHFSRWALAECFHHVDSAHHIRLPSIYRLIVTETH